MIVHTWGKNYREDCFSVFQFFDCHITVTSDLALSEKYKNLCLFLQECDMNENFGIKMSQKYDHSMICQTAKTLLQAQNTQDYKRLFGGFFTLQSLLCKFKI